MAGETYIVDIIGQWVVVLGVEGDENGREKGEEG